MRRAQKASQEVVANGLNTSVSAVSRLERGLRSLRVDQLVAWAGALGYRVDIVFWKPGTPAEQWDPEHIERAMGLDDACADVLSEVASGLNHMPAAKKRVLIERMRSWRGAAEAPAEPAER
jgi:transcriptional regulator with XRE-family HTH domain